MSNYTIINLYIGLITTLLFDILKCDCNLCCVYLKGLDAADLADDIEGNIW